MLTLHLEPLGRRLSPLRETEQKVFLRNILTALQGLHAIGWVHRDIRFTNTIRVENDWYLIDLELANEVDKDLPPINDDYMPPELRSSTAGDDTSREWKVWGYIVQICDK